MALRPIISRTERLKLVKAPVEEKKVAAPAPVVKEPTATTQPATAVADKIKEFVKKK